MALTMPEKRCSTHRGAGGPGALLGALTAALLLLSSCGGTSSSPTSSSGKPLQTVSYAIPVWNSWHIAAMVAIGQGFMKRYGVNLQVDLIRSPSEGIPGAVAGTLDFVGVGPESTYQAQDKGANIKIVAIEDVRNAYQLIVHPNITSVQQLKGQTFVVNTVGVSLDYITARVVMSHLGFAPSEYHFINGGPPSTQVAAMIHGTAQVDVNFYPYTAQLTAAGFKVLLDVAKQPYYNQAVDMSTLEASPTWYKEHHSAAVGFMEGLTAAMRYLHDPAHKAAVTRDIAKQEGVSLALAADTYKYLISTISLVPTSPSVTLTALENGVKADDLAGFPGMPAPTATGLAGRYDNSLVKDAQKALGG